MVHSPVTLLNHDLGASSAALLTLTRGASWRSSFGFERSDAGKRITLGSTPNCDWQIVAGGVSQLVLFFTGEELWLGIERENRLVFLNDATVPRGWKQLHHGDRLELGGARVNITLAPELRTTEPAPDESTSKRTSSPRIHLVERPSAAVLRLVRSSSERVTWMFRASDLGASVSVGAGKHCDWVITTGGFEIRELTLLFAGGILLVRREQPGNRVRLDGRPLGDDWTYVAHGSRIEIGLACLEFQLAADQAGLPPLPPGMRLPRGAAPQIAQTTPARRQTPPPSPPTPKPSPSAERANLVMRSGVALARVSTDQLARREAQPSGRPRRHAVEMSKQSMEAKRPPEAWVQACVPAVGRKPRKGGVKLTSYALFGLLLAVLYAGWLVLLERF